jgi:hypothetical protein
MEEGVMAPDYELSGIAGSIPSFGLGQIAESLIPS